MLQLLEGVLEGGGGHCGQVELIGNLAEEVVPALPDDLVGLLGIDSVLADETCLHLLGHLGKVGFDAFQPHRGDGGGRHIGLGIHPGGSGQRPGVPGGSVGKGIPGLLGDSVESHVGPLDSQIESGFGLLLWCGADDERIELTGHSEVFAQPVNLCLLNSVVGKLVGVEDSLDSDGTGVLCHLGTQPEGLVVAVHDARESGKPHCEDLSLVLQGTDDNLGLTVLEEVGDVHDVDGCGGGSPLLQDLHDPDQVLLPVDLVGNELGQQPELLYSLDLDTCTLGDGDVEILPDGSESPLDPLGGPEQGSDPGGDLVDLLGSPHVGCGGDLDEGNTQTVGPPGDGVGGGVDLTAGILLKTYGENADLLADGLHIDGAVHGDQGGPLESGGVGTVDDDLPHELHFVDDVGPDQLGEDERGLHGLGVDLVGRLLVELHQTGLAGAALIAVSVAPHELCQSGAVDLSHLGGGGPEAAVDSAGSLFRQVALAVAEELVGVELLMDLDTAHHLVFLVAHSISLLSLISPARQVFMTSLAASADLVLASAHMSLA